MGVHAVGRGVVRAAEAHPHRQHRQKPVRLERGAVLGRVDRADRRPPRQQLSGGGVGVHPLGRELVRAAEAHPHRQQRQQHFRLQRGADLGRGHRIDRRPHDNSGVGAAWVYTRSGGTWSEQEEATPTEETGYTEFGSRVALSSDGTTALIGGHFDNSLWGRRGCTRARAGWGSAEQKITATDKTGQSEFGWSVALSSDGKTALIGGPPTTAVWGLHGYSRARVANGQQQREAHPHRQQPATASSATAWRCPRTGSTALIGGPYDNNEVGAAWVYTRSGGSCSEQQKLTPTDNNGNSEFGYSVALTSDGSTALIGGLYDKQLCGGRRGRCGHVICLVAGEASLWGSDRGSAQPGAVARGAEHRVRTTVFHLRSVGHGHQLRRFHDSRRG